MKFLRGMFLDEDKPSFSRVFCAFIVVMSVVWVSFALLHDGKLPEMGGVTGYVSASLAVLYGSNKIAAAIGG